jgi:hypothetical protein
LSSLNSYSEDPFTVTQSVMTCMPTPSVGTSIEGPIATKPRRSELVREGVVRDTLQSYRQQVVSNSEDRAGIVPCGKGQRSRPVPL